VSTILDVAAGADLIVVGRRGTGSPDAPQLGSTSLQLVAESAVPVVVIARPA
jgi:nucleotide-binding universal stress UspA family protein